MPKKKANFDWSILDRKGIAEFITLLEPAVTGKLITTVKFHKLLAAHIKKYLPVNVTRSTDPKVDSGWVYTGGTYFSHNDQLKQKCIEILFVYRTNETKFIIPVRRFRRIALTIADTILHEIIHMRQYRRRKFKELPDYASTAEKTKKKEEQSYLGCSDEIDAYGFNIACELLQKFRGDTHAVVDYLNENQKGLRRRHNGWRMYLKAFDYDHDHKIIKRVKSKVIRYLPRAEIGKPFKSSDWICY